MQWPLRREAISFPTGSSKYQGTPVKEAIPPAVTAGLTGAYRARARSDRPPRPSGQGPRIFDREILTGGLGQSWWLQQCYLKPYACCGTCTLQSTRFSNCASRQGDRSLRIETFPQGLEAFERPHAEILEAGQYSFYFSALWQPCTGHRP